MHFPSFVFYQVVQENYSAEVGNQVLIAESLSDTIAKNYENQIMLARDTPKNVRDVF